MDRERRKKKKNKVIKCSVPGCNNKKRFHFPKDDVLRAKWLRAIRRDNFKVNSRTHGLCEIHFGSSDFVESNAEGSRARLRRSAIPSLFSWNEDEGIKTLSIDHYEESVICGQKHSATIEHGSSDGVFLPNNCDIQPVNDVHPEDPCQENQSTDANMFDLSQISSDHSTYCLPNESFEDSVMHDINVNLDSSENEHLSQSQVFADITQSCGEDCEQSQSDSSSSERPPSDVSCSNAGSDSCEVQFDAERMFSFSLYEEIVPGESGISDDVEIDKLNDTPTDTSHVNNMHPRSRSPDEEPGPSQHNLGILRSQPKYSIEYFADKPQELLHCTGLENYEKFMTVLWSLGPGAYHLKYIRRLHRAPSVPNQLLLVLWKLRRNESDTTLAMHFDTDRSTVGSIFITWIMFMSQMWSLIDLWPSRELVDLYMPDNFKMNFPSTRGIFDATEWEIERPTNPRLQQASWSNYKNRNTMKAGLIMTPGGLMSYCSKAFGGATSDRQMSERTDFLKKCDPGDVIMADKGFCVQDIFAPYGVTCLIPSFVKKGFLPHHKLMKSRLLSKHRIHIERGIGLVKTFKILKSQLNHNYVPLASEIIGVCAMLANFKENIMTPKQK